LTDSDAAKQVSEKKPSTVLTPEQEALKLEYKGKPWMFNDKGIPYSKNRNPKIQAKLEKARKRAYELKSKSKNTTTKSNTTTAAPVKQIASSTPTSTLTSEQEALKTEYAGKPWMFDLEGIPLPKMSKPDQQQRYEASRKKIWLARNNAKELNAGITTVQSRQAQKNIEQVAINSTGKQYQSDLDLPELDNTDNVAAAKTVAENYVTQNNVQSEATKALIEPVTSSPDVEPMNYVTMNAQTPVETVPDVAQPINLDLEALRPETAVNDSVQTMTAKLDSLKPAKPRKLDYKKPAVVKQRTNDPVRLSDVPTIIDGGGIGLINLGVI